MMQREGGEKRGLFPSLFRWPPKSVQAGLLVVLALTLIALALVGRPLLAGRVYNGGDITRLYLPQRVELARALHEGRLPWWSARLGLGYPLLAEGEVGALYPLNWLIYAWLSPEIGLTLSIVLHYIWAALGLALFLRAAGRSWWAALLGAVAATFGGFVGAHLTHISMLTVAAWLPWMLLATRALITGRHPWRAGLALVLCVALQFLAGHPQISLLGLLAVGALALWEALLMPARRWRRLAAWVAALAAGVVLALPQLVPAVELALQSQRAGGLDTAFFTSYSFHPLLAATLLSPFVQGAPDPEGSVELMAYIGLLPLALAVVALRRGPGRERWFWAGLSLLGLLLAFGRWNPLYAYLQYVPVFNLFRVPARYLYWTDLGLACLAAQGADALVAGAALKPHGRAGLAWGVGVLAALGVIWPAAAAGLACAVAAWRWLPLLWAVAVGLLAVAVGSVRRGWWGALALLVLLCDLAAYNVVLERSYHTSAPVAEVRAAPLVTAVLQGGGAERLYVKEDILPALSVMQGALYPNVAASYGLSGVNLYAPLVPQHYLTWAAALDNEALSRVGVTHYLIPQLLPVDAASELYDVYNPYAALAYGQWIAVAPCTAQACAVQACTVQGVEIESYLSHAADLPDGTLAATIAFRLADGAEIEVPLRVGLESAEWAYEREDVAAAVQHHMPTVAQSWPSRSGYLPWEHVGHTYRATVALDSALAVTAVEIRPVLPEAYVRIEEITLLLPTGERRSLRTASGQGRYTIVYRSEDVLAYANEDAWPRAFAVPWASVTADGRDVSLAGVLREAVQAVEVVSYDDMAVQLHLVAAQESLLVLSDLDYPGWQATLDGQEAAIWRVDGVVRGVRVPAGEHAVAFSYRPLHRLEW